MAKHALGPIVLQLLLIASGFWLQPDGGAVPGALAHWLHLQLAAQIAAAAAA